MKPDDTTTQNQDLESQAEVPGDSPQHDGMQAADNESTTTKQPGEWQLWPPSPKMQIVLIAIGFGLFNLILIGIWAAVMVYRFN